MSILNCYEFVKKEKEICNSKARGLASFWNVKRLFRQSFWVHFSKIANGTAGKFQTSLKNFYEQIVLQTKVSFFTTIPENFPRNFLFFLNIRSLNILSSNIFWNTYFNVGITRKTKVWRQIDSEAGFIKSMHISTCVGALTFKFINKNETAFKKKVFYCF